MNWSLFLKYISLSFQRKLTYRFELVIEIFSTIFFRFVISYFLWDAVFKYSGAETLNGYTFQAILVYYFFVPFVGKMVRSKDTLEISLDIYEGGLNKFLLYPSSYFFVKYSEFLSLSVFYFAQFFIGALCFQYFFQIDILQMLFSSNILLYLPTVFLANLCMFFLMVCVEQIAFWADHVWSLGVFVRFLTGLFGGAMIPLSFFPVEALFWIEKLPFRFFFSVPIAMLTGTYSFQSLLPDLLLLSFWTALFFIASQWVWSKGRWKYSGVGI